MKAYVRQRRPKAEDRIECSKIGYAKNSTRYLIPHARLPLSMALSDLPNDEPRSNVDLDPVRICYPGDQSGGSISSRKLVLQPHWRLRMDIAPLIIHPSAWLLQWLGARLAMATP
jgi:hypothetical protein